MEKYRFKQLLESTMGNVKPLIVEDEIKENVKKLIDEIYQEQKDAFYYLMTNVNDPDTFKQFKGTVFGKTYDDDEESAWTFFETNIWNQVIVPKIKRIESNMGNVGFPTNVKENLEFNNTELNDVISGPGRGGDPNCTFKNKFLKKCWQDGYIMRLKDPYTGKISLFEMDLDF
jgi:hypothetical protein